MGNPIKYSTSVTSGSYQKGNTAIGVNPIGYGPTLTTGWYNSPTPTGGNFIVTEVVDGNTPPRFYAPSTLTDWVNLAKQEGATGANTASIDAVKSWFASQANYVVTNIDFPTSLPSIVGDGLVLNLNASINESYPGSGTTWTDLSGIGGNTNLFNGPVFNSSGYLDFDGTDDYGLVGGVGLSTTAYTKIAWFNPDQATANIISGGGDGQHAFWMAGTNYLNAGHNGAWSTVQYTGQSLPGKWWMGAVTFNTSTGWVLYLNGNVVSTSPNTSTFTGGNTIRIAAYNNASNLFNGKISQAQVYNRVLSQTEILQNYYQAPIVTDGLVLALDAGNLVSYESGSGTTINDLTSYNNNGTLINGVGFSNQGVPRFILDGVDDTIATPKDLNGFTHNIQYDIDWTIECWMYMYPHDGLPQHYVGIYGNYNGCNYTAYKGNAQGILIYNANNPASTTINLSFGPLNNPSGSQCPNISMNWTTAESGWVANNVNKWCHFVITSEDGTYYKIYVNGVQQGSTKTVDFKNSQNRIDNNLTSTSTYRWGGSGVTAFNQIDFSIMRMYNRPLSASEITQNFNAQRSRFGI